MVTATRGFRHDSIAAARETMSALAASTREFTVDVTEDVPSITRGSLGNYDVLVFALTTGELPFDPDQKNAILDFVSGGKGFLGVHSATDTLYDWPEYGLLVGAYFKEHPWTQTYGSGRSYYNALGHFPETWRDVRFQRQLLGAIRWLGKG